MYLGNLVLLALFVVMIRRMLQGRRHWVLSVVYAALGAMGLLNFALLVLAIACI
ncbi:MAG: hypothetical protein ACOY94_06420 [Bacillota bacterium]